MAHLLLLTWLVSQLVENAKGKLASHVSNNSLVIVEVTTKIDTALDRM
jgi:hypothetical protein